MIFYSGRHYNLLFLFFLQHIVLLREKIYCLMHLDFDMNDYD